MPKKKKRKIKYTKIILFLIIIYIICFGIYKIFQLKITNIYIIDNYYLTDQEIIDQAGIKNYPSTIKYNCFKIKKKLLSNKLIKDAKVKKEGLTKVYITIIENKPLFFDDLSQNTILGDGSKGMYSYNVPTLLNYIPNTIYDDFLKKMNLISINVLNQISEITYDPDEVDEKRFLLYMIDGNYVYLTLTKFELVNNYLDIMKDEKFQGKKGILYLDSGNHFQILDD